MARVLWLLEPPAMGGAERYVLQLLDGLTVEAWVVSLSPLPAELEIELNARDMGARIQALPAVGGKADVRGLRRVVRAIRRIDPDVVHVNANAPGNARHAVAAALLARKPVVLTVHTVAEIADRRQRAVLGQLYRRCSAVIAVSDEIRQVCVGLGAPSSRVHLVTNGVATQPPAYAAPDPRLRLAALGRLTEQKGFDVLLGAVRLLHERGHDVCVRIGGGGPQRRRLEALAHGLNVDFVGPVANSNDFWDDVDIACVPSRFEGLPFVLLEAMMAGVAVVATRVGDVPAAVGDAVVLVPPEDEAALADAIASLGDHHSRRALGAKARAHVLRHLSLEAMLRETAAVYEAAGLEVTVDVQERPRE